MTKNVQPSDLEFAALISSKICHDIIGPVSAIHNGLEMMSDDQDPSSHICALDVVRNVTEQASARLQFARFAFGAAGSNSAQVELETAREIVQRLVGNGKKHQIIWSDAKPGPLSKNQMKLLLNLIACAITALPRGGMIKVNAVQITGNLTFALLCSGKSARPPQYLNELLDNSEHVEINALSVQAYYAVRLANETGMRLSIDRHGDDIQLTAETASVRTLNQPAL